MPCHPPHRPSRTTPIQTHRPSLASNRARKRSAVPTRFSGAHKSTHSGPPPASQPSPPLPSLAVNWRGQEPRHLGARARLPPHPNWRLGTGLGHPVPGTTTPQATRGPGWATRHRPSPPLPSNAANWQRAGHIEIAPPATQALRLALSGKGPRPVHPANWRRVLDVESRPSSTCDARGRSLGVSPPPSARRCRGTLMGRCVLHKSSQGSG